MSTTFGCPLQQDRTSFQTMIATVGFIIRPVDGKAYCQIPVLSIFLGFHDEYVAHVFCDKVNCPGERLGARYFHLLGSSHYNSSVLQRELSLFGIIDN